MSLIQDKDMVQTLAARQLRGERLRDAVTRAYARKYHTKASEKWVRGFEEPGRAATTLELLPVQPSPDCPQNV